MADKNVEYEVFAYSAYGSDVVIKYTLEEALECAEKWSMESIDTDIFVIKITKEKIKSFRNGGEIG